MTTQDNTTVIKPVEFFKSNEVNSPDDSKGTPPDVNENGAILSWIFEQLLGVLNNTGQTIVTLSKGIQANAQNQYNLNRINGDIHFVVVTPNDTPDQMHAKDTMNQNLMAARQNIQSSLMVSHQVAGVMTTKASQYINSTVQTGSMIQAWIDMNMGAFKAITNKNSQGG